MPRGHRAQLTQTFPADRAAVWDAINDFDGMPRWWPAVKSTRLERLTDGTVLTWNQDAHGNEIPFKTTELKPYNKLVRMIAATEQSFGGTWTFELGRRPLGRDEALTLTEDGWIGPPVYRAVAKWIVGLDSEPARLHGLHLREAPGRQGALTAKDGCPAWIRTRTR